MFGKFMLYCHSLTEVAPLAASTPLFPTSGNNTSMSRAVSSGGGGGGIYNSTGLFPSGASVTSGGGSDIFCNTSVLPKSPIVVPRCLKRALTLSFVISPAASTGNFPVSGGGIYCEKSPASLNPP
jgi:hypothetical protein